MLYFAVAEIVQVRSPLSVLLQIFRDTLGGENVPGITAIHHSLCHVNASSGDIRLIVNVRDPAYRPAVDAHAYLELRMNL